jgi:hypothetical protein
MRRIMPPHSRDTSFVAALVHDAALTLADDAADTADRDRYLGVAVRLGMVLDACSSRDQILAASPYVVERSGKVTTVVEMIEYEPGNEAARLRLVTLLMRALLWEPATRASAREVTLYNWDLSRYHQHLIGRRLDELHRLPA